MSVFFRNSDITIYNRYLDATGIDKYQRTVIKDVNWQGKRNATVTEKGLQLADSTLIFIDKLPNYVSPKRFAKLDDTERVNYFTFRAGDKIVKGEVDIEITRAAELEKQFDDVVDIKSVTPLPNHFEVEGV